MDFLTILWKKNSKISEKKKRKLVLLALRQTKIQIVQLGNALDADPKIILSQNVWSHLRRRKENVNKVSFQDKEKGNSAKENSDDDDDLKVYTSMAQMSNDNVSKKKLGL